MKKIKIQYSPKNIAGMVRAMNLVSWLVLGQTDS